MLYMVAAQSLNNFQFKEYFNYILQKTTIGKFSLDTIIAKWYNFVVKYQIHAT